MGLQHVDKRVVISVDLEAKNTYRLEGGTEIRLEREFGNFNQRYVKPVNAIVISAENIPEGSEILIWHNSVHDSNRVFDYGELSGESETNSVKYYSIPEDQCYAWKDVNGQWQPLKNFAFALRVIKPYRGLLEGIDHEIIKDVLYLTSGELSGNVVHTLKSCDYEIVFQDFNTGREDRLIRLRHSEDEDYDREEVIAISHDLTERVNNGELFVGLSTKDAKSIKNHHNETKSYAT